MIFKQMIFFFVFFFYKIKMRGIRIQYLSWKRLDTTTKLQDQWEANYDLVHSTEYLDCQMNPKKEEGKTQTTKAPTAEVSAINPTSGFRLTSTRPRAPPIIISLSDLTISCTFVTNSNHHKIRAPPWQATTTTWWEWVWGWVGEWMRVKVRVTEWDHKGRMRVRVRWERRLSWEKMRVRYFRVRVMI